MTLDNVVFHTEEDYPQDLNANNAAVHMGFYWAWIVRQQLHNPQWDEVTADAIMALKTGKLSGAQFVMQYMDGGLEDIDFNEEGLNFTLFYYHDEEEGYGRFMEDYIHTLNTPELPSFYHVADTEDNQALLNLVFDAALTQWRGSLSSGV